MRYFHLTTLFPHFQVSFLIWRSFFFFFFLGVILFYVTGVFKYFSLLCSLTPANHETWKAEREENKNFMPETAAINTLLHFHFLGILN